MPKALKRGLRLYCVKLEIDSHWDPLPELLDSTNASIECADFVLVRDPGKILGCYSKKEGSRVYRKPTRRPSIPVILGLV